MKKNEGPTDRLLRVSFGLIMVLVTAALIGMGHMIWGIVAAVIAVVMILTAAVGFCPAYAACGVNTRPYELDVPQEDGPAQA